MEFQLTWTRVDCPFEAERCASSKIHSRSRFSSGVWTRLKGRGWVLLVEWLTPRCIRCTWSDFSNVNGNLHWNCTKLVPYWSYRFTVVQFYPQDQRSSIQTPAPSIPTVYHLYCTSCIKHILFLANGRLSRHLDIFLILDLQTFPLIWSAPSKKVSGTSKKVLHGAFPVCRSPTGLM